MRIVWVLLVGCGAAVASVAQQPASPAASSALPIGDPGFLGAVVGAVAGLLGALIGGAATYFAAIRQYRTEHHTKQNSALAAVLIEICSNQQTLIRELDRSLPLWLCRCYDAVGAEDDLKDATWPIPAYHVRICDTFFAELLSSVYGPELKTYYDRIAFVNALRHDHPAGIPAEHFAVHVRTLALAIEIAYHLTSVLQTHASKAMPKGWGIEDVAKPLEHGKQRALYMAALHRTSLNDLESFLGGDIKPSVPNYIIDRDPDMMQSWLLPARVLYQRHVSGMRGR